MKRFMFALSLVLYGTALFAASDLSVLVQSERDFSKLAGEKGIRAAFLEFLAEDSVVFHNGAVNGRKWYEGRPDTPGILYWQPAAAELSAAGDLGYSTGPWEFRKSSMTEAPVAFGTFVSIWKKQSDGRFRVAVDFGSGYPSAAATVASLENTVIRPSAAGKTVKVRDVELEQKNLMQADREFSMLCAQKGAVAAYAANAVPDVRIVRDGSEPFTDPEKVRDFLGNIKGALTWEPLAAGIASSGDLGYTYGESSLSGDSAAMKGDYLRVWKRQKDGKWMAILDVISARK